MNLSYHGNLPSVLNNSVYEKIAGRVNVSMVMGAVSSVHPSAGFLIPSPYLLAATLAVRLWQSRDSRAAIGWMLTEEI